MSDHGMINWTDASGDHSFTFQYYARQVPFAWMVATRHDNIASSGVKEAVIERVDNFTGFDMEFVASGTDVGNWSTFMQYALQGGQFQYYPDADLAAFISYTLEDKEWLPAYKYPGMYTFKLRFRQVV